MSDQETIASDIATKTRADLGVVGLTRKATEGSTEIEVTAEHVALYLGHRNAGLEVVAAAHATTTAKEGEPKLSLSPRQARIIEATAAARHLALAGSEPAPVIVPTRVR